MRGLTASRGFAFLAVALLGLAACAEDNAATTQPQATETTVEELEPIKIGSVFGFSGPVAASGTEMVNGLNLAVDTLNEQGGVLGHPIELILEDDQNEPQQSVTALQRILSQDPVAFVGAGGTVTGAPMAEILNGGIPSVLALTSSPAVSELNYPNIILMNPPSLEKEAPVIEFIGNLEGVETVAMILQNNDYAKGLVAAYEEAWADGKGPEIAYTGYFQNDQADYSALVAAARATNPDGLYIIGFTEQYHRILQQAEDIGFRPDTIWLASEGLNPNSLALDSEILEGIYGGSVFNPFSTDPITQAFTEKHKALYGIEPGFFAATPYDSMMYLAAAIEAVGSIDDGEAISQALRGTEYTGVRGPLVFNEVGHVLLEGHVVQVIDGAMVNVDE